MSLAIAGSLSSLEIRYCLQRSTRNSKVVRPNRTAKNPEAHRRFFKEMHSGPHLNLVTIAGCGVTLDEVGLTELVGFFTVDVSFGEKDVSVSDECGVTSEGNAVISEDSDT